MRWFVRQFLCSSFVLATTGVSLAAAPQAPALFAAVQGEVQWTRSSGRTTAAVGEALSVGDRVRTATAQRVKLLALDAAVLDLAPATEIAIDELSAVPEVQRLALAVRMFRGRMVVRASSAFAQGVSHCTVETGTASISVPQGEVVIRYDPEGEFTEVAVVSGEAAVAAKVEAMAGGRVRVPEGHAVRISKGRLPQAPVQWGPERIRQYAEGIEIFGTGRRDGLNVLHPLTLGRLLDPSDVPGVARPAGLASQAPGLFLPDLMSADVYTNTQPIEVFRAFPPGRSLTGDVRVDF
ncbi:MAG: hypothetical protein KatS3mg077_2661 [Candidatus Binatia bacterium]|nr:MAG: hypothetical protein KatS3mg077_2661 [Candidatus Binatia bacterium]